MTEKNILAYFKSPEEAEGVNRKLRALRVMDSSIDRVSRYPGEGVSRQFNPLSGDFSSLGTLTLGGDFTNQNTGILSAADVCASGMSHGGQGGPTGRDVLLTAVVPEESYDKALRLIEEAGGRV